MTHLFQQRQLLLSTFLLFITFELCTQNSIQGKVFDDQSIPLEFANVLLLQESDSSFVNGSMADIDGSFVFDDLKSGQYILEASMVGFESARIRGIALSGQTRISVDSIVLTSGVALNEIEVIARKPLYEQKIDRLVVNVENSIVSTGSTVLDILERSPGVMVNRQQGQISLVGKEGVVVLINGKNSYMPIDAVVQMLDGMNSENIESIELITSPPAKFEAEGNAGFINIILKQRTDVGLSGSYSLTGGYGRGVVSNDNINFNFRKNKFNLYGGYGFVLKKQDQEFINYRTLFYEGDEFINNNESLRDPTQRNHNGRLGLDIELGERTIVGVLLGAYDNKWSMTAENMNVQSTNQQRTDIVNLFVEERNQWTHQNANFNLSHQFNDQFNMSVDLDYLHYRAENPTNYQIDFFDGNQDFDRTEFTRSDKVTPIDIYVGKIDFTHQMNSRVALSFGGKTSDSRFENDVAVETQSNGKWIEAPEFTNVSVLNEKRYAVYGDADFKLSDETNAKFGLRYEYTDSKVDINIEGRVVDRQFGALFPNAFITHQLNDDQSVGLAYSRRITRPTFNDMAPFVIFMDPNTFVTGNASLQPAFSQSLKFDYRFKSLILSLQYSVEDSTIARFQERSINETNQSILEAINMDQLKSLSATLGFPIQFTRWWESRFNFMFIKSNVRANYFGTALERSQSQFQSNASMIFSLPQDWSAELSGNYYGPQFFFNGVAQMKSTYTVNFGIQKKLGERAGTLSFNIRDLFNSYVWNVKTEIPEREFLSNNTFDLSQTTFSITYSRNFGNQKLKKSRQRGTGSDEERKRVSG